MKNCNSNIRTKFWKSTTIMENLYRALFVSVLAIIAITITSCEEDEICPGITCAIGQLQLIDCTCIEDPSNGSASGEQIVSENITTDVTLSLIHI